MVTQMPDTGSSETADPNAHEVDLDEQYEALRVSVDRLRTDTTLTPGARQVAEFLAGCISCKEDLLTVPRLSMLWRGGIYLEWGLTADDLDRAMQELRDKGYRF